MARELTKTLTIPTIGIGASSACDGQILVSDDMLGLFQDFTPRFVKRFAELAPQVSDAAKSYAEEVRARSFPGPEHVFGVKK
ncbi:3-methyl-2-oxobutanoate hydroxymethyltransferase [compost metagenome]